MVNKVDHFEIPPKSDHLVSIVSRSCGTFSFGFPSKKVNNESNEIETASWIVIYKKKLY